MKQIIHTNKAPQAIGTYSQAVKIGNLVFLSGQIPLNPATMTLVDHDMKAQVKQVFDNINAVVQAAGGNLTNIVKLTVFLLDLTHFTVVNEVMAEYFKEPYPARSAIGVASLPRNAQIEVEAVLVLES